MSNAFCIINQDKKTRDYIRLTLDCMKNNESFLDIDNKIQKIEIERHCNTIDCIDKNKVACDWIGEHGKDFRIYLNMLKTLSFVLYVSDKHIDTLSDEEYEKLRDKLNHSEKLLNYIF